MRHRDANRKLNRTSAHQQALLRNLAQSMIEHGQVRTTLPKARHLQPYIERLITLARRAGEGSVTARRSIHKALSDRSFVPADRVAEYEEMSMSKRRQVLRARSGRRFRTGAPKGKLAFTGTSIVHHLITDVAPRFADRPGGYTRLIKLATRRIGDASPLAILQFVGEEESPGPVTRPAKTARRRRADARYAFAVKLGKQRHGGPAAKAAPGASASAEPAAGDAPAE